MTSEQIEQLLASAGLPWSRIVKGMWKVDDPNDKLPGVIVSIEPGGATGRPLLKFVTFICDVPRETGPEFFQEFLRLNFRMDHGAFALESKSEMCFIDTLELAGLDPNEFEATMKSMLNAPKTFQEKYDIDIYSMGKPLF